MSAAEMGQTQLEVFPYNARDLYLEMRNKMLGQTGLFFKRHVSKLTTGNSAETAGNNVGMSIEIFK